MKLKPSDYIFLADQIIYSFKGVQVEYFNISRTSEQNTLKLCLIFIHFTNGNWKKLYFNAKEKMMGLNLFEFQFLKWEAPGLVLNAEDSQSEPPWMWVRIPASPKN